MKSNIITVYVLSTIVVNSKRYIFHLITRNSDQRHLVELTGDINKAFIWQTKKAALATLQKCITNDRVYNVEFKHFEVGPCVPSVSHKKVIAWNILLTYLRITAVKIN